MQNYNNITNIKQIFAKRLGKAIKESKYTRQELADKIYISLHRINQWCAPSNQTALPDAEMLMKICDLLGVEIDYLLGKINGKTHRIDDISNLTGLSTAACEQLINDQKRNNASPILSLLILQPRLIDKIHEYCSASKEKMIHFRGDPVRLSDEGEGYFDPDADSILAGLETCFINDISIDADFMKQIALRQVQNELDILADTVENTTKYHDEDIPLEPLPFD